MSLLDALTDKGNKILVIGAHPDDVEFSTGRLLIRREGKNSFIVCMTDGRKGQEGTKVDKLLQEDEYSKLRETESRNALKILNIDNDKIHFMKLPDQDLISNPFVIDSLFLLMRKIKPDFLIIPPWEGAHPDHDTTHLFSIVAAKNSGFNKSKIIEYGSYNNYKGKFRIQEFIPMETDEEKLLPSKEEQEIWHKSMKEFKSQLNQQEHYIPQSKFENFRLLPDYNYKNLPYSRQHAKIIRDLLSPFYPIARKILPKEDKLFYETWKSNINPEKIKKKLNHYIEHYGIDNSN